MDFSPLFEYKSFLLEADDDNNATGGDTGGNQEAPADNNADTTQNNDTTANTDNDSDLDINLDDNLDDTTGEGGGSDSSSSLDSGSSDNQGGDPNASVDTEAKRKDRELFDSLTPQEQKMKTVELKRLYMDLYDNCDQISEKFEVLGVEFDDLSPAITAAISSLFELKNLISTHLLYLFDAKTYYENDIQYNQFLLALNKIKLITDDMVHAHKEEIEDSKSFAPLNAKDIEQEKGN